METCKEQKLKLRHMSKGKIKISFSSLVDLFSKHLNKLSQRRFEIVKRMEILSVDCKE
jgi:hypothetical protein